MMRRIQPLCLFDKFYFIIIISPFVLSLDYKKLGGKEKDY